MTRIIVAESQVSLYSWRIGLLVMSIIFRSTFAKPSNHTSSGYLAHNSCPYWYLHSSIIGHVNIAFPACDVGPDSWPWSEIETRPRRASLAWVKARTKRR